MQGARTASRQCV